VLQRIDVGGIKRYPLILDAPLEELGTWLWERYGSNAHYLIISNQSVADLYMARILTGLQNVKTDILLVPEGEEEKSLDRISKLTEEAIKLRADRDTIVLALGGGVIGDLSGFFASVFFRGIRYVQVPTTFLAHIDSSIGGKVAVNHSCGKNLLGAFSRPQAVWTDFSTLQSLPWAEIQNGLAETVKHALVADADLFTFIEDHIEAIRNFDFDIIKKLALRSLAVKVKIVNEDENEKGVRMLLNLGHSFGHAIETALSYNISHGQGVSIGIAAAANLSLIKGLLSENELDRIINLLAALNLPREIAVCDPHVLLKYMEVDKKNKAGKKVLVLPVGIGKSSVVTDCEDSEIIEVWKTVMK